MTTTLTSAKWETEATSSLYYGKENESTDKIVASSGFLDKRSRCVFAKRATTATLEHASAHILQTLSGAVIRRSPLKTRCDFSYPCARRPRAVTAGRASLLFGDGRANGLSSLKNSVMSGFVEDEES